ncbi:MAG: O-methyltransferase [Bacteroidota bacterium]
MSQEIFSQCDEYIQNLFAEEDEPLANIIKQIDENNLPQQSVSAVQGKLLQVMASACNAKRILEVGTFVGYSTVWLARALPADGKVITIELEENHAAFARNNFKACNVSHLIDLRVGNALDILHQMKKNMEAPFDFVFIDADKKPYVEYFLAALELSRRGTIIISDNVIREGNVLQKSTDEKVIGVQRFNKMLAENNRVVANILQTVGNKSHDGMAIAVVK